MSTQRLTDKEWNAVSTAFALREAELNDFADQGESVGRELAASERAYHKLARARRERRI